MNGILNADPRSNARRVPRFHGRSASGGASSVLDPGGRGTLGLSRERRAGQDGIYVQPIAPPPLRGAGANPGDPGGEPISSAQAQALRGPPVPTPAAPPLERPARAHGRIMLSTGREVELDRSVVIGRRPRAVRVTGSVLPHLIAVESPQQDISRSHIEIRTEGDAVLVVDLDTTNGTVLIREGAPPVRLHPGEPTIVIDGDVVDLGDEITVTFRGIG